MCRSSRQNPKFKMDRQDTKFSNSAKQELADVSNNALFIIIIIIIIIIIMVY